MTSFTLAHAATVCFVLAILHTFSVGVFNRLGSRFREGSVAENLFHMLGEVEVVFGLWASVYVLIHIFWDGYKSAVHYLESLNFTEPAFVFVVLAVCSTKPILDFASMLIGGIARMLPLNSTMSFYFVALTIGPILGSLITEPAAMTVTALLLVKRFFGPDVSTRFKYATLGLLFVNISIGGTLTHFAAPPVLMVAGIWNWDLVFMLTNFGWKGALSCFISTTIVVVAFRKELSGIRLPSRDKSVQQAPFWVIALHLLSLALVVANAHHIVMFAGIFLFFLGLVNVTQEYQDKLGLKEGLLVAFFLGGLVVLGGPQRWWLEPILTSLDSLALYMGAMGLTAITDNAALTYLGAQVPTISETSKYALVAGAVVGGGLTVIANAPNPAGYGILNPHFKGGISPIGLLLSALPPTFIAALCFWLL